MKYFVTGATGFIGGHVARQLLAAGHEVITLARTPSKAQALVALGVKMHAGDITDQESLRAVAHSAGLRLACLHWYTDRQENVRL